MRCFLRIGESGNSTLHSGLLFSLGDIVYSVWAYRHGCSLIHLLSFVVLFSLLKPKVVSEETINFQWLSIYDYLI